MKKLPINYLICIIITTIIIVNATATILIAQPNKNSVFDTLVTKYGKINSVEVIFRDNNSSENYNLKAQKGNKFVLNIGKNKIICNGKTIWNYNHHKKNVIINDFIPDENNFTVNYFFFNVLNNLQPISLSSQISTLNKNNKTYLLELGYSNKMNKLENNFFSIKNVKLTLNEKLNNIINIEIITNSDIYNWNIIHLQFNKHYNDLIFEFKVPKDIEEIDMRS